MAWITPTHRWRFDELGKAWLPVAKIDVQGPVREVLLAAEIHAVCEDCSRMESLARSRSTADANRSP
jgi:hypothetical protein